MGEDGTTINVTITQGTPYEVDLGIGFSGGGGSGSAGATGATGPTGVAGNAGAVGATGSTGPSGTNGTNGAVGATGATGPQGVAGNTGSAGSAGATGATGPIGVEGLVGATGATGANGSAGSAGATGSTGPTGSNGSIGATGSTGPTGISFDWDGSWTTATAYVVNDVVENLGSSYICILGHTSDNSNEAGVGVDTATYWELMAQVGAAGSTGATGPAGNDGGVGATGATGNAGAAGATGATGPTGDTGAAGAVGATGAQGTQGIQGVAGPTGATGPAGTTGGAGATGNTGAQGTTGATGPKPSGQLFLSAAGMWPSTTAGSAANTKSELSTNKVNLYTLDFDATTQEYAEAVLAMPSDWDAGTITAQFYWMHPATVTNFGVRWGIQGRSYADDDALDQAAGTAQEVTDTGGTTSDLYISVATSAITITGATAGELVRFRVYRDPANGADNMAVDAKLLGVMVNFGRT